MRNEGPLARVVLAMKACPTVRMRVEGHTDSNGNPDRNQRLSVNRARSVTDFLTAAGIAADRLTATGFGETRPIVLNDTESNRARNRRIEFVVE